MENLYNTDLCKRGTSRAKFKSSHSEIIRADRQLSELGIGQDIRSLTQKDIYRMLDINYCGKIIKVSPMLIASQILDGNGVWGTIGSTIIIEGGSFSNRDKILKFVVMMAYFANMHKMKVFEGDGEDGIVARIVSLSEILPIFNSYDSSRYSLQTRLSSYPVLAITDIYPENEFKQNGDGKELFDSVIIARRRSGLPTIICLNHPREEFSITTRLGRIFESVLRSDYSIDQGVMRIRLSDQKTSE